MLSKKKDTQQSCMFLGLKDMLNQKHPMYILANKVDWQMFEDSFSRLYSVTMETKAIIVFGINKQFYFIVTKIYRVNSTTIYTMLS